jgi:DNA polymerase III delta prime subunit
MALKCLEKKQRTNNNNKEQIIMITLNSSKYNELFSTLLQLFFVVILSIFINIKNIQNINDILITVYNFVGGQYLMSTLMNQPVYTAKKITFELASDFISRKRKKEDLTFFEDYEINNLKVSSELEKIIQRCILKVDGSYNNKTVLANANIYCKTIYDLENTANDIPKINKPELIEKLDNLLSTYDPNTRTELIEKIVAPFIYNMFNPDKVTKINPICLVGPPGVGKTRFVHEFANILETSVIDDKLYEGSSYSYGTQEYPYDVHNTFDNKSIKNKYIHVMAVTKKRNFINFLDEFDKDIAQECGNLLKFLTTEPKSLTSKYLSEDIVIKFPNILTIMASNKKFRDLESINNNNNNTKNNSLNELLGPLEDRIVYIEFPSMSKDLKLQIAKNFAETNGIVNEKYIIDLVDSDKEGGVRSILNSLQETSNLLKAESFFRETKWNDIVKMKYNSVL